MTTRILVGDCRPRLRAMPDNSVHIVWTSPPFYGLRDYQTPATIWGGDPTCEHVFELEMVTGELRRGLGMEELSKRYRGGGKKAARVTNIKAERGFCRCGAWRGHLGLEPTPQLFVEHMVEVFREVRRVLRSDGTLWVNLGDSYANDGKWGGETGGKQAYLGDNDRKRVGREKRHTGLKPKDLIGIPWKVAQALQEPYYAGRIKREADRAWLAALVDGEGCLGIRRQSASGNRNPNWNDSYIPYLTIKMSDRAPLDKAVAITGFGEVRAENSRVGEDARKIRTVRTPYLWRLDGNKAVSVARELFPHLLVKAAQAALIHTLDLSNKEKRRGKGNTVPVDEIALRDRIFCTIKGFNQRKISELPDWCELPPSLFEEGWWLRQDDIWSKPNPMPESVTDRCTKSHEYVFMFSKSARYFFDALAIAEGLTTDEKENYPARSKILGRGTQDAVAERGNDRASSGGFPPREEGRNKRSVWNIATAPFSGEFCRACQTYFEGDPLNDLHVEPIKKGDITERRRYCSCGSWDHWLSHFATFPTELAEIPIKAGTSEHGCCATCRAPWERQTEKRATRKVRQRNTGGLGTAIRREPQGLAAVEGQFREGVVYTTVGWRPTCKCEVLYPLERPIVLDCFSGAGTTGLVADRLGRDSILLEANADYAVMSEQRIRGDATLLASVTREAAE